MRCSACSLIAILLLGGVAAADANYTMTISMKNKKPDCALVQNGQPTTTTSLVVRFTPQDKLKISAVTTDTSAPVELPAGTGDRIATIDVGAMKESDAIRLTVTTDKGVAVCEAVKARAGSVTVTTVVDGKVKSPAPPDDSTASRWWLGEAGASALDALSRDGQRHGLPDDTQFLVYLPSGRPAFATPTSVREGAPVQIVMIQPTQGGPDVQVATKNCAAVKAFRVTGDDGAQKQGGAGGITRDLAAPTYELSPRGPSLRCGAGSLTYDLQIKPGDGAAVTVSHTLDVRPVYSFALVTALGFDTTISHDFQAVPAAGGGNVVAPRHDRVGPAILVGGQWMIGGVDYTDMRWYNYVANPFVAFSAAAPLAGFVVGDTLTLRGGISLAIGLAAHEGTRLKGVRVGDPLDAGDVPKDATWHEQRLGLYVGVAFDSKVFEALKAH